MKAGDRIKWKKDGRVDRIEVINYIGNYCYLSNSGTWSISFITGATVPYNTKYYYERVR